MTNYIAIIHKDQDSDFGVSFPDFPGCITAGSTIDEAKTMAIEALTGHIESMVEDGEEIPKPSGLENIMADPDFSDGVAFLVNIPEIKPKAVRINISVPEVTLRQIDAVAKKLGLSRSSFLVQAAKQSMQL